jgi:DNA (cytosine-5)-methyltransferase 1
LIALLYVAFGDFSLKHLDLFSGIGGFALAAQWAGIETVAFCEIDDFACKVLNKNFPDVPVHRDIRELDGSLYAGIDLITGGYPCQPFSTAGKRKGADDPRHLWPEMFRVIRQARPTWVVCENVAGHISMGLDAVLADMEGIGYAGQAVVIPACAKDAPHERKRVWIIFHAHSTYANGGYRPSGEDFQIEKRQTSQGKQERNDRFVKLESGTVTPRGTSYAGALRILDGIPDRVDRNKALGNAIVPQVAYEILRCIRDV